MAGVVLVGHGGFDKLDYREDIPVPKLAPGEVLTGVAAGGVNIPISIPASAGTRRASAPGLKAGQLKASNRPRTLTRAGREAPMVFPRIRGADCCGRIVAMGDEVNAECLGERVLVCGMLRTYVDFRPYEWLCVSACNWCPPDSVIGAVTSLPITAASYLSITRSEVGRLQHARIQPSSISRCLIPPACDISTVPVLSLIRQVPQRPRPQDVWT